MTIIGVGVKVQQMSYYNAVDLLTYIAGTSCLEKKALISSDN